MAMTHHASIPAWAFMWGLSFAIYGGLKALSWLACSAKAPAWKHLAYLLAWPGMDADRFLRKQAKIVPHPTLAEWMFACGKFTAGVSLLWIVIPILTGYSPTVIAMVGMIGIVLTLHFGLFHLLSCVWRRMGIAAVPIMNSPFLSQSLTEFWGRRWNLAFRDLTHRFLFLPLVSWLGAFGALFVGFVMSGLVHDLVISWPAHGGYGLPTIFFLIQAVGIMIERSSWGRRVGLGSWFARRLFCVVCIVLPSPLLFHGAFLQRVIVPFLMAIGSTS